MQKNKQFYDDFFTSHPVDVHDNPARFCAAAQLLSGKVLDVACGTGTLADYYLGEYVGVDISDVAIAHAKKIRRKDATFLAVDFTKDAFVPAQKFDCAYLGEFLEHIEDDKIVFDNLIDLLKPNGKIIVTVPNADRVPDESHCRTFTVPQIREEYRKYGKITFHNWEGFKDRIMFSIELGSENNDLITLVMCVKNEAKGIETAIISALPFVDRVIVSTDTATTDQTAQIADLYADKLTTHEWHDNFSQMRNNVQMLVDTKWTLFLDGHEYVESTGNVRQLLLLDNEAILVNIQMENGMRFKYPRIFQSHLKFADAVHNSLNPKSQISLSDFVIVHDRDNLQTVESSAIRAEQRDRMIPEIMKASLKKNPHDQRALFNLANWHMSKLNLKEARKFYKRCYKLTKTADERYFVYAQYGMAHQLAGHNLRALFAYFDLEKIQPDRWETKRLIAGVYMAKGKYKKALAYLTFALEPNKQQYMYNLFGFDLAELWDLIASCYMSSDEPERALIAWGEAVKFTNDEQRKGFFNTKRQLANMLIKNPDARVTADELQNIANPLK